MTPSEITEKCKELRDLPDDLREALRLCNRSDYLSSCRVEAILKDAINAINNLPGILEALEGAQKLNTLVHPTEDASQISERCESAAGGDEWWDQNAVQCGNCSVEIVTRRGSIPKNNGLSDNRGSEDECLCGRCAGEEMYAYMDELDEINALTAPTASIGDSEASDQIRMLQAWRDSLKLDKERLKAAAKALIARLHEMERPLNDLCVFRQVHGMPYTGPNWREPLKALKEAAGLTGGEPTPSGICNCNVYAEPGPIERAPNCPIHGVRGTGGEGNG